LNNKVVSVSNLSHSFEQTEVLKDISFDLNKNEFITFIGPSGCGKSTLFKVLTKLIINYSGTISIQNIQLDSYNNSLGYMPQKDLLLPWRTLYKNIILPLELKSEQIDQDHIYELIKTFGLEGFEEFYPHQLSGGMKQRAALLRTFLMSNDIVLLDEPFAALDYLTKRKLQSWLKDIFVKLDKSALFITHDIEEAINLSDRIIVLSALPASILEVIDVKDIDSFGTNKEVLEKYNLIKQNIIQLIG